MFTGLVESCGRVRRLTGGQEAFTLEVACPDLAGSLQVGDSVAVNGVCLTVTAVLGDGFQADVMPVTARATNLGDLRPGDPVNLERPLRLGDRLGGHIVLGHVDGTGTVSAVREDGNARILTIALPQALRPYVVPRGSLAVDGVSLTVARTLADGCEVSIIPHTAAVTTLGHRRPGDRVNVEVDILAKHVEALLPRAACACACANTACACADRGGEEGEGVPHAS
ncbi:MAG: riboflavin synthase [Clostridia bacterium]|nr:riboflavin synthase [Clostridia bacterium]